MAIWARAGACLGLGLVLVGASSCTNDATEPTPSVSTVAPSSAPTRSSAVPSSATATNSASPSPSSTAAQHEALVKEAISQFTKTQVEVLRITKSGGVGPTEVPPTLLPLLMGESLDGYTSGLRMIREKQVRWVSGEVVVWDAKDMTAPQNRGSLVTLSVCTDGTKLKTTVGSERRPSTGTAQRATVSYRKHQGMLKMFQSNNKKDPKCKAP